MQETPEQAPQETPQTKIEQKQEPVPSAVPQSASMEDELYRVVVAADNSCMFRCLFYLLDPECATQDVGPDGIPLSKLRALRSQVAAFLRQHPDDFSEAVLGKPVDPYTAWIQTDEAWGGMSSTCYVPTLIETRRRCGAESVF